MGFGQVQYSIVPIHNLSLTSQLLCEDKMAGRGLWSLGEEWNKKINKTNILKGIGTLFSFAFDHLKFRRDQVRCALLSCKEILFI